MNQNTPGAALSDADILAIRKQHPAAIVLDGEALNFASDILAAADRRLTAEQPQPKYSEEALCDFITIEKRLCDILGRPWAPSGFSIETLCADIKARLTAEQGGNLLVWADPPTYTAWGACMKEALLELDKDHTLRLFAEEDALELVAPALRAALTTQPQAEPAHLPCGHPASLMLASAETGEPLYCELCDDKSGRRDAEQREAELSAELAEANETLRQLNRALGEEVNGATFMGEPAPTAQPQAEPSTFEEAWAVKVKAGYQYGHDALEQVRFGWEIRDGYARGVHWPLRGVRVEGDTVVVSVNGGNEAARWLCGELVKLIPQKGASGE